MKKPENFKKIDSVIFETRTGNKYMFSTDDISPELWVFQQPDTTQYALAFIIDWERESYEIKRAKNGDGANWIDTIHQGNFSKDIIKTMQSFVEWAHYRVLTFEYEFNKL